MTLTVPFLDLAAQHREIEADLAPDLERIFATTAFVGGRDVAEFEADYASFTGASSCVGVANGTDALELALRALDVEGGEVIAPANTFIATVEAIVRAGARPVLVDCDDEHLLLDPQRLEPAITPATRAIMPVHLYGQMAPVEAVAAVIGERPIALVEDAAQSQGATRHGVGSGAFGVVAGTSFYPGKNLGAAGDAGAVTTSDPDVARRVRLLANHGSEQKYVHETLGFNSRLDTLQAAVLRHKLRRLPEWNAARRAVADRYAAGLADLPGLRLPVVLEGNVPVWHLYVVRVDRPDLDRTQLGDRLRDAGVATGIHYPDPVHLTGAFAHLAPRGAFPVAEAACAQGLSLPMFPHLDPARQDRVIDAVREILGA